MQAQPDHGSQHENHAYMDRLVESHRSYAHAIAADILLKLPPQVERAELQSAAELGLVEAAASYDSTRGVQFKTFAYYRIRGAVYDFIRKATWFTRKQYQQYAAAAGANDYFADQTAAPDANGPAATEELDRHAGAVVTCFMLSLETSKTETPTDKHMSAEDVLLAEEAEARIRSAVTCLPERNRRVIEAYYYQNRTLEEIGAELGLSKSWTCRLHAKGIEMLRHLMQDRAGDLRKRPALLAEKLAASNFAAVRPIIPTR